MWRSSSHGGLGNRRRWTEVAVGVNVVGLSACDRSELAVATPEVEFPDLILASVSAARGSEDPVWVLADDVIRRSAWFGRTPICGVSVGVCRLLLPGEVGTELAVIGNRGVYASASSVSGLLAMIVSGLSTPLLFTLDRPCADDEDFRVAGLEGTKAEAAAGDDDDEDAGGSGRVT